MSSNEPPTASTSAPSGGGGGGGERRRPAPPPRPTLTVPSRTSVESLFHVASPGPLTLASTLFPNETPDSEFRSFTQLLVGAINSPASATGSVRAAGSKEERKEAEGKEEKGGRPESLAVPVPVREDVFTIPPGLSPTGLFSPVMGNFGISHQQALAQVTAQAAQSNFNMLSPENHPPSSNPPPVNAVNDANTNKQNHEQSQQPPILTDKPADDGYNWRKYGQKLVKGSDYPRSYYKCTSSSCPVKKKVERSVDGQISEIIYKGQHNHPPPTNRRGKDVGASNESGSGLNGSNPNQNPNLNSSTEFNDNLKRERELTEQMSGSSDSEEEGEEDDSKKRRIIEANAASQRTLAEPRIIVQTTSEVDLLDDGYRWRKYGQKVVKGNPYPRSYYKCTYSGCNVKKHIERSAQDPKSVITTYEGKHNHDLPVGRNSSHVPANSFNENRGQVAVLQLKQEHEIT
ncbi:WRKY family transcription factor family protein [Rhynchospora pubera]|uniref:WRKY family transcription factor family protein n=1 Tax=Rhynchospora pubera TaxID=906938 RepID=A0AAV8HKE7_9POAL|nr:WRKY family transcription factor family protein [Rhynchospora pubera]